MTMTRRRFMGWMGAAAVGGMVPGVAVGAHPDKRFLGHVNSKGVLHDITRCIGCRRCEAACNRVHALETPERPLDDLTVLDQQRRTHHQSFTVVNRYAPPMADPAADGFRSASRPPRAGQAAPIFVKTQCNHCLEPACASACFVKAFQKKDTGAVVYDESLCVGCRYCMIACPFNIPTYEYNQPLTPRIRKCDLCHQRQLAGLPPGCVAECPKEALTFGPRNALLDIARRRIGEHAGRYIPHIYGEHEMGGTSWMYLSGVPFGAVGMNERLGNLPASAFTASVLETIPIIVGLWPVLLTGIYAISRRKDAVAEQERRTAVAAVAAEAEARAREQLAVLKKTHMTEKEAAVLKAVEKALAEAASKGAAPEA
jgi:formate dehydrogenase iron-sulfur subunit